MNSSARNNRYVFSRGLCTFLLAAMLLSSSAVFAAQTQQERIGAWLGEFKKEGDPVRRAKLFPHLGELQIDQIQRYADAGDYVQSGSMLEAYRDEVKITFDGLKNTGVNAERKPNGFKELQIHLRKALKQIDDVLRQVPEGPRVPFQLARDSVAQANRELIEMLFPPQPGKHPKE